jgi:hypothetical protein
MSYPALPEGWTFFVLGRTARVDLVSGFYPLPDNLRRLPALHSNARDRSLTRVSRLTGEVVHDFTLPLGTLFALGCRRFRLIPLFFIGLD